MKPVTYLFMQSIRQVRITWLSIWLALAGAAAGAQAAEVPTEASWLTPALMEQIRQQVLEKLAPTSGSRAEIQVGHPDARLRLAPCEKIEPQIPGGVRLLGNTRIGLRCVQGPARWNIYVPVAVTVYGPGLAVARDLPAGHVLQATDLQVAEVNLSESRSPVWTEPPRVLGRTLAHPVASGQALRQDALKPRQWFAAGDTVQVRTTGGGFSVVGSAEAVSAGMDGQLAKVRVESGKIISGRPVAERQLEVDL